MDQSTSPKFSRILVPLDGSDLAEQALPFALSIGGDSATYFLVTVLPHLDATYEWLSRRVVENLEDVEAHARADARTSLLHAAHIWLGERPQIEVDVLDGDPATAILQADERYDADLVVIASHGRGSAGRLAFGSVADRITRHARGPVLVIRPQDASVEFGRAFIDRIVVPIDGSTHAKKALPYAAALARGLAVPIILVQAVDVIQRIAPYPGAYAPPPDIVQEGVAAAAASLATSAQELRAQGITVTTEIRVGPAVDTIDEIATTGDVIVLSSRGWSGFTRWVLGSVAEKLVRSSPVPVMIVPGGTD